MSQTTTSPHPVIAVIRHPAQTVMALIVTFLAPMFLGVTGGDAVLARAAAIETVNSYRAQSLPDLIAIALMVGYGLAALDSLNQSFDGELSVSMMLRLRNNANACTRSAEKNRRAVGPGDDAEALCFFDVQEDAEAATIVAEPARADEATASMDETVDELVDDEADEAMDRLLAAQSIASLRASRQTKADVAAAPEAAGEVTEKRRREMLAIVLVKEAGEIDDSVFELPPEERESAILQAATLRSMANQLLTGGDAPDAPQPR